MRTAFSAYYATQGGVHNFLIGDGSSECLE